MNSLAASLQLAGRIAPPGARLRSDLDVRQVWPNFLVWLAISVCTLGFGWIVVSGHFFRLLLNSVVVIDAEERPIGRLVCDYDVEADVGRILRWALLCLVTGGLGLLFYSFRAGKLALSATRIEWS